MVLSSLSDPLQIEMVGISPRTTPGRRSNRRAARMRCVRVSPCLFRVDGLKTMLGAQTKYMEYTILKRLTQSTLGVK